MGRSSCQVEFSNQDILEDHKPTRTKPIRIVLSLRAPVMMSGCPGPPLPRILFETEPPAMIEGSHRAAVRLKPAGGQVALQAREREQPSVAAFVQQIPLRLDQRPPLFGRTPDPRLHRRCGAAAEAR
jgi:hypothetical protein